MRDGIEPGGQYLETLLPTPLRTANHSCGINPTILNWAADTTFDDRSRGQVMADTLVERVTGRPAETPEPVAVNLVMTDETLLGGDTTPAVVEGYGPIPAAVARTRQRCRDR